MPFVLLFLVCLLAVEVTAAPEGFEMKRWASPPEVEYPTALTAAADGTVYISEDRNASLGKDKNRGSVVRARDTDGDGKADEFTDFLPNIDSPRGGHFVGGTLYLIHPPYLGAYRDTTGDGVADEHKVLLDNLGAGLRHPRGADHTTNGCRMGIDGWIYIAVGDFGMEGTIGTDKKVVTHRGGAVARVRPDGTDLEIYSYNVRNICDIAISPRLDLFARDNTNDGKGWNIRVHQFSNSADFGYPRLYKNFADEAAAPMLDLGGGSGTGGLYLSEPGLPELLLTCDWTTGKIYHDALTPNGSTFQAKESVWLGLSRATDVDVDGSGRLYTADWRGGKYKYAGDGVEVGAVHLLTKKGHEGTPFPDLKQLTPSELSEQLNHGSAVRRLEAQREILRRAEEGDNSLAATVLGGFSPKNSLEAEIARIFTIKQLLGAKSHPKLRELAQQKRLQEFAIRALADRAGEIEMQDEAFFSAGLQSGDPRVQLQATIALGRLPRISAPAASALLTTHSRTSDRRLQHTIVQSLASLGKRPGAEDLAVSLLAQSSNAAAREALAKVHTETVANGVARKLSRAPDLAMLAVAARLFHQEAVWNKKNWWSTRPDDRGPYYEPVVWNGTTAIKKALEKAYQRFSEPERDQALEIFGRNRIPVSQLDLGEQDPIDLALRSSVPDAKQIALLAETAKDPGRAWPLRLKTFRALNKVPEGKAVEAQITTLGSWLTEKLEPEAVQRELRDFINQPGLSEARWSIREVAKTSDDQSSRVAWQVLLTISKSPLVRRPARVQAQKMTQDNPREVGFFLALADLKMTGFDAQIAAALETDNDRLIHAAKVAREILAKQSQGDIRKVTEVAPKDLSGLVLTEKGDAAAGADLYVRQGCIACHAVDQKAVQKGPYLGGAGAKFSADYLLESVLEPNAVVAQGFQTEMITMNDGAVHMGFVTNEADGEIDLRSIAGTVTKLQAKEIKTRAHLPQSMMPAGLVSQLTVKELEDLMTYLIGLGK